MCMHCALVSLRSDRPNGGTMPQHAAPRSQLTRRSFGAGALAVGLTGGKGALAQGSSTVKIGTFGPFTGPAAGLGPRRQTLAPT